MSDVERHLFVASRKVNPRLGEGFVASQGQQFVHHLKATHNGHQMVRAFYCRGAVVAYPTSSWIVTFCQIACKDSIGQLCNTLHTSCRHKPASRGQYAVGLVHRMDIGYVVRPVA